MDLLADTMTDTIRAALRPGPVVKHSGTHTVPIDGSVLAEAIRRAMLPRRVVKAEAERRYVLGIAASPHVLDVHDEFISPGAIEEAAWDFLSDGSRQIGLWHQDGTLGHAQVVESFIWRWDPWETTDTQGGTQLLRPGDWLLGAIFDDAAWRLVKQGRVIGWSIDGWGKRVLRPRSEAPGRGRP